MSGDRYKDFRHQSAFVRETSIDSASIVVRPENYWDDEAKTMKLNTKGGCREKRRVLMFADAWIHFGGDAPPNWWITIDLPSPIPFRESLREKTVHDYIQRDLLNPVGTAMKSRSMPWRWISVIEVKGGLYHVHGLAHFPCEQTFLQTFFKVWKKVADPALRTRKAFQEQVFMESSGTPLYATPVDPRRQYRGTGRYGAEGVADYMVKTLDEMTPRRRFRQEIGSPAIISREVNNITRSQPAY